ncbi:MAG: amidohydrolase family protein [Chloroflexota bacterium]
MFDLLLRGGMVVDGLGTPAFRADVAVQGGRIAAVGDLGQAEAERTLDCAGHCISPGWVDIHGHADGNVLEHPLGLNLLVQGCTATVAGNCGSSVAPLVGQAAALLKRGAGGRRGASTNAMLQRHPEGAWDMGAFLDAVDGGGLGVNYVQLVGHNALRQAVMGNDPRPATEAEVAQMVTLLEAALDQGALGLSSGLVFIPGCWATTEEVIALAKVVGRRGGVYASHIRGERETNIEATQEFIRIAEEGRVRAQMSHMQSKWPVYGNAVAKMEMLEQAMARGVALAVDSETFPNWASTAARFLQIYQYTPEQLVTLMGSPAGRQQLKQTMRTVHPWHPLGKFGPGGVAYRRAWDRILIYDCPHDRSLEGKTVGQVAAARGIEFEDALFDLTVAEKGKGPRLIYDYIEDDHYRTAPWKYCTFPSIDTGLFDPATALSELDLRCWRDTGYPGTIGLAPRVLGQFVREERLLSLEEAIRKMTSLSMQQMGVYNRGVIRPGLWADLTVFDPQTVALRHPNADPARLETFFSPGIPYVIVNGVVTMEGGRHTGARAGRVLR